MAYANPFRAKPVSFRGRQAMGTIEVPGFHTAQSLDVAVPYAQLKVQDIVPTDRKGLKAPIDDYPVIVELDMRGLRAEPDYDALHVGLEAISELLHYFDGDTVEDLRSNMEHGDVEEEDTSDAISALFTLYGGISTSNARWSYLSHLEAIGSSEGWEKAEEILKSDRGNGVDIEFLVASLGQFKYSSDVDERRLMRVYWMKPFFDRLFPNYDDPEFTPGVEKTIELVEASGYATISLGNVYDHSHPDTVTLAWEAPALKSNDRQLAFEFHDYTPRPEFHGTSYMNLLAAADFLRDSLPVPPPPYGYSEAQEDESGKEEE